MSEVRHTFTELLDGVTADVVGAVRVTLFDGVRGPTGATGATGAAGSTGPAGANGVGVPVGGLTGQSLTKNTGADYDTGWATITGGGGGGAVDSVNTQTGVVVLSAADVGALDQTTGDTLYDPVGAAGTAVAALDAGVVHLTGNETIAGEKTFTGQIVGRVYAEDVNDPSLYVRLAGSYIGMSSGTFDSYWLGSIASGPPAIGAVAAGSWLVAQDGHIWVCTATGDPGTWVDVGAGGGAVVTIDADGTLVVDGTTVEVGTDSEIAAAIAAAASSAISTAAADATTKANAAQTASQPLDADLTTIAALDSATAGALSTDGAGWIRKTYAQLKTALGLVKADVGLGSVDNTSDASKPVSTAQAAADTAVQSYAVQRANHTGTQAPSTIVGTAVVTADSRLSDARTPTAHATTHAPAGSDDLTTALSAVAVPVALGTAATGTGTGFSRQGHVHPTTGLALSGAAPTAHAASHASGGSDATSLAASQITSGVLAIARLATGTPDGTKYVRDDGTLVTPTGSGIQATTIDAKGDLLVGTANDTVARKAVGTDFLSLVADSTQSDGLAWVDRRALATGAVGNRVKTGSTMYHSVGGVANAAGSQVVSRLHAGPNAIDKACTVDRIGIYITVAVASSTVRLGIYADDGNGIPAALVLDAGTVDTSTTGFKELTVSTALTPGLYWTCAVQQGGATLVSWNSTYINVPTPVGMKVNSSTGSLIAQYAHNAYYQASVTGALPNPMVPATNDLSDRAPRIVLRIT